MHASTLKTLSRQLKDLLGKTNSLSPAINCLYISVWSPVRFLSFTLASPVFSHLVEVSWVQALCYFRTCDLTADIMILLFLFFLNSCYLLHSKCCLLPPPEYFIIFLPHMIRYSLSLKCNSCDGDMLTGSTNQSIIPRNLTRCDFL
jgi:hypothetical protein